MLKRLIILDSDIYSKADIELDKCNSLQIVGLNNIGKSTLIYALNFLFIIDVRENTILDINHSQSIYNELLNVSQFSNNKRFDYTEQSLYLRKHKELF